MICRSLLARSNPARLSAALTTRLCSRSLSTLRLAQSARCAVPSCGNSRRFSAAPAFPAEDRDDTRTPRVPTGTCFIANIPYKVTAQELKDAFSEFGKIESVTLPTTRSGLPRGIGFVQFESVADAISFVEGHKADPIYLLDRQMYVEHAETPNVSRRVEPSHTLLLSNFQGESEVEVRTMFGSYADNILEVRFNKKDSTQVFIQFRNVNIATEAMGFFKNQDEDTRIRYAIPRQSPANSDTLISRLSRTREH